MEFKKETRTLVVDGVDGDYLLAKDGSYRISKFLEDRTGLKAGNVITAQVAIDPEKGRLYLNRYIVTEKGVVVSEPKVEVFSKPSSTFQTREERAETNINIMKMNSLNNAYAALAHPSFASISIEEIPDKVSDLFNFNYTLLTQTNEIPK